jgi:hypothetical protein
LASFGIRDIRPRSQGLAPAVAIQPVRNLEWCEYSDRVDSADLSKIDGLLDAHIIVESISFVHEFQVADVTRVRPGISIMTRVLGANGRRQRIVEAQVGFRCGRVRGAD